VWKGELNSHCSVRTVAFEDCPYASVGAGHAGWVQPEGMLASQPSIAVSQQRQCVRVSRVLRLILLLHFLTVLATAPLMLSAVRPHCCRCRVNAASCKLRSVGSLVTVPYAGGDSQTANYCRLHYAWTKRVPQQSSARTCTTAH
jgi:hypothetical protein